MPFRNIRSELVRDRDRARLRPNTKTLLNFKLYISSFIKKKIIDRIISESVLKFSKVFFYFY